MEQALRRAPATSRALLVELFEARFDPDARGRRRRAQAACAQIERGDRRRREPRRGPHPAQLPRGGPGDAAHELLPARADGAPKPYLSFKLDPTQLPLLPLPRPRFEIFVYSPRVEGVHLRGGRVARGGLRWSDRREDFRTEVLGLMKAQMVKNARDRPGRREGRLRRQAPARRRTARRCRRRSSPATGPSSAACSTSPTTSSAARSCRRATSSATTSDDPYLVVAADKGTATFSDIANAIAGEYGFWLGDAFASGGSAGYDHKEMGITARGAWESVKRHFRELGIDVADARTSRSSGIGDMSGDVFGNGMLLSPHIRLVGGVRPPPRLPRPGPRPGGELRRAQAAVRRCRARRGRTTTRR